MDLRCKFVGCNHKIKYGCSCNSKILLCSIHYIKHMKEEGIHQEILLIEKKHENFSICDTTVQALDEDKQKFINKGEALVNNIINSIREVNETIDERKKFVKNILESNSLEGDTNSLMKTSIKANYNIQEGLKESALEYFQMFNNKITQNSNTDQGASKKTNLKNIYNIILLLSVICIIIPWLCILSAFLYRTTDKTENQITNINHSLGDVFKKLTFLLQNQQCSLYSKYIISGSSDNTVRIWNILEKSEEAELHGNVYSVRCVAISSDNKYIASGSYEYTVRIWNLLERTSEAILIGHTNAVYCVAFTSDGRYVVSGSEDFTVRIWNLLEKKEEACLIGHTSSVLSVAITFDNKYIISGSYDKSIRIWDLLERCVVAVLTGHDGPVRSVAISPDNKYIISGSDDNTIRIWDLLAKSQMDVLEGHTADVYSVAITSDSKYIISGSVDRTIRIWNFSKRTQEYVLRNHTSSVTSIAITFDNKYIISGSSDNTIRVWSLLEKRQEYIFKGHTSTVWSVAVTHNNKHILNFREDKNINLSNNLEQKEGTLIIMDDNCTMV